MVTSVTSLTGNGLKDWLIQRMSAIYFMGYSLFVLGYFFTHPHLNYEQWHGLFHCAMVQVATVVALFALSLHSWVGIWTVTTDYITCSILRVSIQMLVITWLLGQLIWGLMIVWGQ